MSNPITRSGRQIALPESYQEGISRDPEVLRPFISRYHELKAERETWHPEWLDVRKYLFPRMARGLDNTESGRNNGERRHQSIINNTATLAAIEMGNGIQSGMTPRSRPWFRLHDPDPSMDNRHEVRQYCEIWEKLINAALHNGSFYDASAVDYRYSGGFGTGVCALDEDMDIGMRFSVVPLGDYYIANGMNGIDVLYRDLYYTTAQMIKIFGDAVSEQVKWFAQHNRMEVIHHVIHAVEPNDDRSSLVKSEWAFRSVYFEDGGRSSRSHTGEASGNGGYHFLRSGGHRSFPFTVTRFIQNGDDAYGTGIGIETLGDIKQLQMQERRSGEILDELSNPALLADGSMASKKIRNYPGGITYMDESAVASGRPGISQLYNRTPSIRDVEYKIERVEARLRSAFYNDLFKMFSNVEREMTAHEVAKRYEEKMNRLDPFISSIQNDKLKPTIDRIYYSLHARGMGPKPPPILQGRELEIQYMSIIAEAAMLVKQSALQQFTGFVLNSAQAVPGILDNFNSDGVFAEAVRTADMPTTVKRSEAEVQALREQRADELKRQQSMQESAALAKSAKDLAQAPVSEGNALGQVMNAMGGGNGNG